MKKIKVTKVLWYIQQDHNIFLHEEVKKLFPCQKFDEEWDDYVEVEEDATTTSLLRISTFY